MEGIPHTKLPISNTKIEVKNVHLSGRYLYALPQKDTKAARHRKKADPYQPTWPKLPKSLVMRGIAVAIIL